MNLERNFLCILEEKEDDTIQRLGAYTSGFCKKLASFIDKKNKKLREQKIKNERFGDSNEQMLKQSRNLETTLEGICIQQQVLNKKITNFKLVESSIRADIEQEKSHKITLTFEEDALQGEKTNIKEAKRKEWNALNRCMAIYKEKLNFHIDYPVENDNNKLKITFFNYRDPYDVKHARDNLKHTIPSNGHTIQDNYYVECLNYETTWKVRNSIQPPLDDEFLEKINLDFHREYDVHDITAFLCRIRKKFIEMKKKELLNLEYASKKRPIN